MNTILRRAVLTGLIVFAALAVFLVAKPAYAQLGLTLFPVKFQEVINPGTSFSSVVTVTNPNDQAIRVQPEVENLVTKDEGAIDLSVADVPYGLSAWVKFDQAVFELGPKERREVPFTITVPSSAEPAGYFGAVLFRVLSPGGSGAIAVSGRVGSVVLVEVPGEGQKTGNITEFDNPGFVAQGPVELRMKIANEGNVHFEPVIALNVSGPLFRDTVIDVEPRVVFPGYSRTFTEEIPNKFLYGPISVVAEAQIPGGNVDIAELTFWAFPWQNAVTIVVIVVVLFVVLRAFKKRFKLVRVPSDKK